MFQVCNGSEAVINQKSVSISRVLQRVHFFISFRSPTPARMTWLIKDNVNLQVLDIRSIRRISSPSELWLET